MKMQLFKTIKKANLLKIKVKKKPEPKKENNNTPVFSLIKACMIVIILIVILVFFYQSFNKLSQHVSNIITAEQHQHDEYAQNKKENLHVNKIMNDN